MHNAQSILQSWFHVIRTMQCKFSWNAPCAVCNAVNYVQCQLPHMYRFLLCTMPLHQQTVLQMGGRGIEGTLRGPRGPKNIRPCDLKPISSTKSRACQLLHQGGCTHTGTVEVATLLKSEMTCWVAWIAEGRAGMALAVLTSVFLFVPTIFNFLRSIFRLSLNFRVSNLFHFFTFNFLTLQFQHSTFRPWQC